MTNSMEELTDTLLALPREDRAGLALRLIESLDDQEEDLPPGELEALWMKEIDRRMEEVETGKVELVPGEEVLREARARLKC